MMLKPALTENIAKKVLRDFFREIPFVFFGTGMSCALDINFGMPALKDEIITRIKEKKLSTEQQIEWEEVVKALNNGKGLENALDKVTNQGLLKSIIRYTANFISKHDKKYAKKIASAKCEWPAIGILKKLFFSLPENAPILHVLTPNYDLLFEYSCDFSNISYSDGLFGGVERKMNWEAVERTFSEPQIIFTRGKKESISKTIRHIRLYKVHGSLNYFYRHNSVIENTAWLWNPPSFMKRVIITPGASKYKALQHYRQELIQTADIAIEKSSRFLFLGYGFNDTHLEVYVQKKLVEHKSRCLIVTRDSNERIESLLKNADNSWLICRSKDNSGSQIYNNQYADWLSLKGNNIWDIKEFEEYIFGGI